MLIESKIRRAGGTPVRLGTIDYLFAPASKEDGAPHVCEVADEEHIATLLAIPEGYKLAGKETKKVAAAPAAPAASTAANPDTSDPLAGMDDKAVRVFVKEKGLDVKGANLLKGDKLRERVRAALNSGA